MRFCDDHWRRLRSEIDDRGLTGLVSVGGEEASRRTADMLANGPTVDNFDPLMFAHIGLVRTLMGVVGPVVVAQPGCPICYVMAEHVARCTDPECATSDADSLIPWAADAALATWKEMRP